MACDYKTVISDGLSEVVEKKSRFLGEAVHVESLGEAEDYIAKVRKRHYDARHHCYAFAAGAPGTPDEILRSSDDGEPQGTAGKPMLEILTGRGLHQTLVVVTRYFGGMLLGTGGLVRAYSAAAKEAIERAELVIVRQGIKVRIGCSYPAYGKFQYAFARDGIFVAGTDFGEQVALEVVIPADRLDQLRKAVAETTDGQGSFAELGTVTFEEPC